MRGQKRVEDARERAYHPRIHLLRKKSFEAGWIAGSGPGNDASSWFDVNGSQFRAGCRCLYEERASHATLRPGHGIEYQSSNTATARMGEPVPPRHLSGS